MRFSIALGLASKTVIGNCFSTLAAIGLPILPTPMKPTFTAIALSLGFGLHYRRPRPAGPQPRDGLQRALPGVHDLVPHLGVLLPVLGPDLFLGDLAERGH